MFLRLGKGDDPAAFERVWRATAEYGLAADWSQPGLWFYGERLICDLLGFGKEAALARLKPGAAMRLQLLAKYKNQEYATEIVDTAGQVRETLMQLPTHPGRSHVHLE